MSKILETIPDLLALLAFRNEHTGSQVAYKISDTEITFSQLWAEINEFAAHLKQLGLQQGARVLIALPNSHKFFPVFYGVQRAGGIPVPLFPNSNAQRIMRIAAISGAEHFITSPDNPEIPSEIVHIDPAARSSAPFSSAEISPDTIAYIQFTSGSTGDPKGVPITHNNLLTNMRQMVSGMEITKDDVFVSWLPVYHDMGLILMTMVPFYLAARLVLLPTSFVNLRRWLSTIDEVRGTYTASPDFGYRLALRYATRASSYNLRSLRVAMNAAESARPETISTFEEVFGLHNVMTVGYGLAEATVGVSMTRPGAGIQIDANGFASVGIPFPDVIVRIMGKDGEFTETGQPGEVVVESPALTSGYFHDPDSLKTLFTSQGYLRTGDIGYMDEHGELYIIGRQKEMLKHTGRTIAPREVESALDDFPGLRNVAAVSLDLGGLAGEQVIVVAEISRPAALSASDMHNLSVDLVGIVYQSIGIRPARIFLAKPHTIPLTANGKMQRNLLKQQIKGGILREKEMLLYPDF